MANENEQATQSATAYANEPIIQSVIANVTDKGASMVQAVMTVTAGSHSYEFTAGISPTGTVEFDISTAARAEFLGDPLSPEGKKGGDTVTLTYKSNVKFLLNGEIREATPSNSAASGSVTVMRGGRTDAERFLNSVSLGAQTIKPSSGEVVASGDTVINGGSSDTASIQNGAAQILAGRSVYIESNPLRRNFAFPNHLGYIETASCMMREEKSYKIKSDNRYRTYKPSESLNASLLSKKSGGRSTWKMSTGYLTREWADWYATEFLMADRHWMYINSRWLPVTITPDNESVSIYDESKGELTAISFTVTSGYIGQVK